MAAANNLLLLKKSIERVMDYPLEEFSTQAASPALALALAQLSAAIRSQSDGNVLFRYSIIHPKTLSPEKDPPSNYPKISISLTNPTVAKAFEIILKFGEINHYVTTDGLCVIFNGISNLPPASNSISLKKHANLWSKNITAESLGKTLNTRL